MDVIRFLNPTAQTKMEQGQVVNGLKSKTWIERYAQAGEFKFTAAASADMRNKLPIGSFVSHTDTAEVMIVENHEITDEQDQDSDIIISGRGYETFFEQRVTNKTNAADTYNATTLPIWTPNELWDFIVDVINGHIFLTDDDTLPYAQAMAQVSVSGTVTGYEVPAGGKNLYETVLSLLEVGKLGIKVVRPGVWSPLPPGSVDVAFVIHQGVDRRAQIMFSEDTGEVKRGEYLWSNKNNKNVAIVVGKKVQVVVGSGVWYNRRELYVDGSDLEPDGYEPVTDPFNPSEPTNAAVIAAMQQRGAQALTRQKDVALTKVELSDNIANAAYRKDFDVGDIITVIGNYNATTVMRIVEYAEIEDQNGSTFTPTVEPI